uniref:Predicted protein n=1 Tax=Hordeum vulgare subsp. vulgare TaxID=112509 RepID=F2E6T2_HORVV|nr:predicted protein [Hordeum vulgare subsp. vulgare]
MPILTVLDCMKAWSESVRSYAQQPKEYLIREEKDRILIVSLNSILLFSKFVMGKYLLKL